MSEKIDLADDMVYGARAIAAAIGWTRRSVYHHAATGGLPVIRIGKTMAARRSELAELLTSKRTAA